MLGKYRLKHILQWMLVPVFDTLNQVFMKLLGGQVGDMNFGIGWLTKAVYSPYLWLSFISDTASFVVWMVILKRANLSFAMPISSICYISILLVSWLFFHELITWEQLLGVAFIMLGVALIGQEEKPTPA